MTDLPGAPTYVNITDLSGGNSAPIDVLGERDGVATLVVLAAGGPLYSVFDATNEALDAEDGMPLEAYSFVGISRAARFMTIWAAGPGTAYWYVV